MIGREVYGKRPRLAAAVSLATGIVLLTYVVSVPAFGGVVYGWGPSIAVLVYMSFAVVWSLMWVVDVDRFWNLIEPQLRSLTQLHHLRGTRD